MLKASFPWDNMVDLTLMSTPWDNTVDLTLMSTQIFCAQLTYIYYKLKNTKTAKMSEISGFFLIFAVFLALNYFVQTKMMSQTIVGVTENFQINRGIICTFYAFLVYVLGLKFVKNSLKTAKMSGKLSAPQQKQHKFMRAAAGRNFCMILKLALNQFHFVLCYFIFPPMFTVSTFLLC